MYHALAFFLMFLYFQLVEKKLNFAEYIYLLRSKR